MSVFWWAQNPWKINWNDLREIPEIGFGEIKWKILKKNKLKSFHLMRLWELIFEVLLIFLKVLFLILLWLMRIWGKNKDLFFCGVGWGGKRRRILRLKFLCYFGFWLMLSEVKLMNGSNNQHRHLGGERKLKGMTFLWQSLRIFASSKFDSMDIVKVFFFFLVERWCGIILTFYYKRGVQI